MSRCAAHRHVLPCRSLRGALLLALLLPGLSLAGGWRDDPLGAQAGLPSSVDQQLALAGLKPCGNTALSSPLNLLDAVRRALCFNPRSREAWAAVEAQVAAVGQAKSAYWPSLQAAGAISQVNVRGQFPDQPELNSQYSGSSHEESLSLSWVLYDFGLRSSNLDYAQALLKAAGAEQGEALQTVFLDAARAYFAAEQTQASFAAELQTEQAAQQSLVVVEAKLAAGVGSEADRLQAKTAYAQASVNRIRADERLQSQLGTLAVAMGIRPGTPLLLPRPASTPDDAALADLKIEVLMRRAQQLHPRIAAARARLEAAQDSVTANKAGGRPNLALGALVDHSDTPVDRVSSRQQIDAATVGVKLSVPLFEGFGRDYRVRQSQAEARRREAELFAAQQDVAQAAWEAYIAVRGSAEDRKASQTLLDSATQSFELALGRYKSGVGTLLELLKAQSDLASAREQDIVARTRWRLARLQLAASLGQIDFHAVREMDKTAP